jgi:AraC-like DNA-binding protein
MELNGSFYMVEPSSCRFTENLYKYPHIHGDYELIFCVSGQAKAFVEKEQYVLTSGKGIFVFPNQLHFYETVEKGKFGVIVFKPEILPTFKKKLSRRVAASPYFDFSSDKEILSLIENMRTSYDYQSDKYLLKLTGYINFIIYYVYYKMDFLSIPHKDAALFEDIIEYCNKHYKDSVSVTALAKELATNSNRISRVFNTNMKMGIPQYVESLRFSDACHLLEMTDYTVAKISEESGFGSIRSMNRAFESFLGINPKDYKKKMTDRKD